MGCPNAFCVGQRTQSCLPVSVLVASTIASTSARPDSRSSSPETQLLLQAAATQVVHRSLDKLLLRVLLQVLGQDPPSSGLQRSRDTDPDAYLLQHSSSWTRSCYKCFHRFLAKISCKWFLEICRLRSWCIVAATQFQPNSLDLLLLQVLLQVLGPESPSSSPDKTDPAASCGNTGPAQVLGQAPASGASTGSRPRSAFK